MLMCGASEQTSYYEPESPRIMEIFKEAAILDEHGVYGDIRNQAGSIN